MSHVCFNVNLYSLVAYSLINSDSSLPSELQKKMDNTLNSVIFSTEDILKILNNLNPNKDHGTVEISIRMLKLCRSFFCGLLQII